MIMSPRILVFDSGLGGLTILSKLQETLPQARYLYLVDNAFFPYGDLDEDKLIARVHDVLAPMIERFQIDLVVIACNTASTLVLPSLREAHNIPFVGTVPGIKPAVDLSQTGMISVLATPGTIKRSYTSDLIDDFAGDANITLIGAENLAALCETYLLDGQVERKAVSCDIMPAFAEEEGCRTDVVVLGCTHYAHMLDIYAELCPWPVTWLNTAPAIAARVESVLKKMPEGTDKQGALKQGALKGMYALTASHHHPALPVMMERDYQLYPLDQLPRQ